MNPHETEHLPAADNQSEAQDKSQAEPSAVALRLFARVFQSEVDKPLLEHLHQNRQRLVDAMGGDPLVGLDAASAEETIEKLAVEYCRLFIGPSGHMAPVESVATGEGRFWGGSTQAVQDFYRLIGLTLPPDADIFPDHVSMQLDCLAELESTNRHGQAAAFAQEHLLKWLPALVKHVNTRSTLAFYRIWAGALQQMLTDLYQ